MHGTTVEPSAGRPAGGVYRDGAGISYTSRCMVGDHTSFGSYHWTYRVDSDSHCKRGEPYAIS